MGGQWLDSHPSPVLNCDFNAKDDSAINRLLLCLCEILVELASELAANLGIILKGD